MVRHLVLIFIGLFTAFLCPAQSPIFETVRPLVRQNRVDEALKAIPNPDKLSGDDKALAQFLMARLMYTQARFPEALTLFETALKDKSFRLYAYALYHIGLIHYAQRDFGKAKTALETALRNEPNRDLQNLVRFQLAQMALEQKHYDETLRELHPLEKKWKHDVRYPEVLYRELEVELKKNHRPRVCKLARKLYADFPGHPLVAGWTIQLADSKVDDQILGCLVSSKDQIRRIHRLQWAGLSDRARSEIEFLRSKEKQPSYFLDSMLAQFLVSEGLVDEAIKVLMKHYELQKNNFGYLNLLAKAAARSSEYQTAVGAYYKAYHIAGGSRAGREALFQAAFLSYQVQDYDGAARKFDEFIHRFSRSGLSKDAQWHLAWIHYLKGDYHGALAGFDKIQARTKGSRKKRKMSSDRIRYWQAMSLMRLERFDEARNLFQSLMDDKALGFYSVAARYRYELLPGKPLPVPSAAPVIAKNDKIPPAVLPEPSEAASAKGDEEEESEDSLSIAQDDTSDTAADETEEGEQEEVPVTTFKSPKLTAAFERANDLIRLGLYDWAKFELYEIESRTRNKAYLLSLMNLYEKIESFYRSSSIGDLQFGSERLHEGLEKASTLWQAAFPQAYKDAVSESAKDFTIPPEIVWSIMRAESQYKTDVISPVGAKGLMQLMPQTSFHLAALVGEKNFAESQLLIPETNIKLGAKYLSRLSAKFENSLPLIAAAYNAGPHRVENWLISFGTLDMDEFIEHIPFVETRDYVKKVVRNFGVYQRLYDTGGLNLSWLARPLTVKAPKKPSPRETWEI